MPPLPIQLVGHTRTIMIGFHGSPRNFWASLVALMTGCVTRAGVRLRVSPRSLPLSRRGVLPSGMHKPWAGSNRYKISELNAVHRRVATPGRFTLITFLCTLQDTTSDRVLIRTLQHSILGTRLTFTQAGFSPASHQAISSPHVHFFVRASRVNHLSSSIHSKGNNAT